MRLSTTKIFSFLVLMGGVRFVTGLTVQNQSSGSAIASEKTQNRQQKQQQNYQHDHDDFEKAMLGIQRRVGQSSLAAAAQPGGSQCARQQAVRRSRTNTHNPDAAAHSARTEDNERNKDKHTFADTHQSYPTADHSVNSQQITVRQSGVMVEVTQAPPSSCTRRSMVGDTLSMRYIGYLQSNGLIFDTNWNMDAPIKFKLGYGQVIPGWDMGLVDMCVNERRRLTLDPDYAYGSNGLPQSGIPPNSVLVFDTELLEIS